MLVRSFLHVWRSPRATALILVWAVLAAGSSSAAAAGPVGDLTCPVDGPNGSACFVGRDADATLQCGLTDYRTWIGGAAVFVDRHMEPSASSVRELKCSVTRATVEAYLAHGRPVLCTAGEPWCEGGALASLCAAAGVWCEGGVAAYPLLEDVVVLAGYVEDRVFPLPLVSREPCYQSGSLTQDCPREVLHLIVDEDNPNDLSDVALYAVNGYYNTEHQGPGWTTGCIVNQDAHPWFCILANADRTADKAEPWSADAAALAARSLPFDL